MRSSNSACPSEDDLKALLVAGMPDEVRQAELENHLTDCHRCRDRLEHLTDSEWKILLSDSVEDSGSKSVSGRSAAPTSDTRKSNATAGRHTSDVLLPPDAPGPESQRLVHQLPGLELIDQIGRGGMATVYRGRQTRLNRIVAVKIITESTARPDVWMRFRQEAQAAARLQHENLVRVHDSGFRPGIAWIVQEYCDGGTLLQRIQKAPLIFTDAAEIVMLLARAVGVAHSAGIVHRDIKAANVLFNGDIPRLADFGIARQLDAENGVTQTGEIIGTPSYMSPEQAGGAATSAQPAVDIYGLGAVLYESLTGMPPFRAATVIETIRMVLEDDPIPLRKLQRTVPRDLEIICLKCLEKSPESRYATANELADDLQRFINREPILARRSPIIERAVRWVRRRPVPATLLVTTALLITGSLLAWGQYTRDVLAEREHAGNMQRMAERRADEALRNYRRARVAVDAAVSSILGDDEPGTSELASGQREVLEHARIVYADLTRENPSDPELKYEQAIAHLKLGQVLRRTATRREAAAEFERAISLFAEVRDAIDGPQESDRRKAEAMLFLAMDARETGNADSGVVLATQALRIVPSAGADDLLRARILATLAWAQSDSGNQPSAIKSYHQAINLLQKLNQREPQSVAALSVLGESAFRLAACYTRTADANASQKFRAMATEARREAVRLSPDSPYPKSSLLISLAGDALVCVRNRRFEDALSILAEAGALGEQITPWQLLWGCMSGIANAFEH
ncbi:MAG: protein kinase [Planctomycetaceae bacterium]|nr:protein kinase [Planctomycetaceae bacterium]